MFPLPHERVLPHEIQLDSPPNFSQSSVTDRFVGSLVGLAVGDALGASVEFRPHQYFVEHPVRDMVGGGTWGLKAGQWTDDTSMALCLASSLITTKGYDPYNQMVRYKWWYKHGYLSSTGQCFDIGNATRDSLEEFIYRQKSFNKRHHYREDELDDLSWDEIQSKETFAVDCSTGGVAGNGALMRLAPVPLFFHKHPPIAVKYAGDSGRLTHGDQKAIDACRYYAALIVAAVSGEPKENLLSRNFYNSHRQWFGSDELHPDILHVAHGSYQNPNGYEGGIRGKGYIVNALEAALWAFWSENSFEKGALAAVNLGDDTDTTAAIYGQLAGAYYGYKSIPKKWLEKLYAHDLLVSIGQWLYSEGQQYNPMEKERKMISAGQSPSITSSSQHHESSPGQLPTYLSENNPPRTIRMSDKELTRNRSDSRQLPVYYNDSNRISVDHQSKTQISSRQPDIHRRLEVPSYPDQLRTYYRAEEPLPTYQSNISHTSTHRFSQGNDLESTNRYGHNVGPTQQYTAYSDDVWKNESTRRNIRDSTYFNPRASMNSVNHENSETAWLVGNRGSVSSYNNSNILYINGQRYYTKHNKLYPC